MLDLIIINPGDKKEIFQDLSYDAVAIEPPYMALSLATFCKNNNKKVKIIDMNADNINADELANKIVTQPAKLILIMLYGGQPSASTQNMSAASRAITAIKNKGDFMVAIGGGPHISALPKQTLNEEKVDFVIVGEVASVILKMLDFIDNKCDISQVENLFYKDKYGKIIENPRAGLEKDLDKIMPVADWSLLDISKYRAHNWHCFSHIENRQPYMAIYTSLGCPHSCEFCCINAPFGKSLLRSRSPKNIVEEIKHFANIYKEQTGEEGNSVINIKIIDEMFVFNEKHYMTIVDLLIQANLNLNIWCYARVDTIKEENLAKMKKAGINWFGLGIESANPNVRDGARKNLKKNNIIDIVRLIESYDIDIAANFIFGLPDDTKESMQETLDMAKELNCVMVNMYCAMAYPGSKLYNFAVKSNWKLPDKWADFSQHSYNMQPLPSKFLKPEEILAFRDYAFNDYFTDEKYLSNLEKKFGKKCREHIENITKIKLKRKLLGD